jgi:hypothetical protein
MIETRAQLYARLNDSGLAIDRLEREKRDQAKTIDYLEGKNADLMHKLMVAHSDRDRLTTTVEILARRIVSPAAESDPTRAGWRHQGMLHQAVRPANLD